jgi:hypothetical protein
MIWRKLNKQVESIFTSHKSFKNYFYEKYLLSQVQKTGLKFKKSVDYEIYKSLMNDEKFYYELKRKWFVAKSKKRRRNARCKINAQNTNIFKWGDTQILVKKPTLKMKSKINNHRFTRGDSIKVSTLSPEPEKHNFSPIWKEFKEHGNYESIMDELQKAKRYSSNTNDFLSTRRNDINMSSEKSPSSHNDSQKVNNTISRYSMLNALVPNSKLTRGSDSNNSILEDLTINDIDERCSDDEKSSTRSSKTKICTVAKKRKRKNFTHKNNSKLKIFQFHQPSNSKTRKDEWKYSPNNYLLI